MLLKWFWRRWDDTLDSRRLRRPDVGTVACGCATFATLLMALMPAAAAPMPAVKSAPPRTGTVKCGSNWDTFTIVAGYVSRFGKYVRSSQLNLNQSAHQSDKSWGAIPGWCRLGRKVRGRHAQTNWALTAI